MDTATLQVEPRVDMLDSARTSLCQFAQKEPLVEIKASSSVKLRDNSDSEMLLIGPQILDARPDSR